MSGKTWDQIFRERAAKAAEEEKHAKTWHQAGAEHGRQMADLQKKIEKELADKGIVTASTDLEYMTKSAQLMADRQERINKELSDKQKAEAVAKEIAKQIREANEKALKEANELAWLSKLEEIIRDRDVIRASKHPGNEVIYAVSEELAVAYWVGVHILAWLRQKRWSGKQLLYFQRLMKSGNLTSLTDIRLTVGSKGNPYTFIVMVHRLGPTQMHLYVTDESSGWHYEAVGQPQVDARNNPGIRTLPMGEKGGTKVSGKQVPLKR